MKREKVSLTETEIKDIAKKSVREAVEEVSKSEKKHNDDNVIDAIKHSKGGRNAIKTLTIFTAQNPDSTEAGGTFNKKANNKLLKMLRDGHYVSVPVEGYWGGTPERSFAVINMSVNVAIDYCGAFQQTGFIYSRLADGDIESDYYEKQDATLPFNKETNPYVVKDSTTGYTDMTGADKNFSVVGKKFKFKIDFSIFNDTEEAIEHNYLSEQKKGRQSFFNGMTLDEAIDFSMNKVGYSPFMHRGCLYEGI